MEFLRVYRGVADVLSSQMEDFHAASYDPQFWNNIPIENRIHTAGDGMYFSWNKSDAEHYIKVRSKSKFGILGKYIIKGDYKIFDDQNQDQVVDENMVKLHFLLEQIEDKIDQEFNIKMSKLNGRIIPDLSEEEIKELDKNLTPLQELKTKTVKKIHELRKDYDISIYQYQEVCIHNPQVKIELESLDLYCLNEDDAREIHKQLKIGSLSGNKISEIEPSYSSLLDKILIEYFKT